jgi:tetratricopeptide (TPR) repeat protein
LHSTQWLGVYVRDQGRYGEAEALLRQALAGLRKTVGDSEPDVAVVTRSLGVLKRATREYAEAERLLREALAIERGKAPNDTLETARTLGELGYTLAIAGRLDEAERLLREADASLGETSGYASEQARREIARRLAEMARLRRSTI